MSRYKPGEKVLYKELGGLEILAQVLNDYSDRMAKLYKLTALKLISGELPPDIKIGQVFARSKPTGFFTSDAFEIQRYPNL
jgi:hypothetical protein